nr:tail fiber domain-containing protein [Limosilactobacillus mucosae]
MSNTSTNNDKTVGDDAKVKLIIGEIGRDTKTGIIGRGYSFDNGNTFHVTDTIFGRLYDDRDADGIWNNGMHEKVKEKVNQEITNTVEPAIKQADSAVAYANDAIEKSRVNQQAIVEINSAVSDAVSDAAVARSDGLRAWNAAQSNVDLIDQNYASASAAISSARTEAIAAADEAKASASAAQADIVAVRSDVAAVQADVTANKSDVAAAKSDIAVVKTDLASQATSLSSYASQASAMGQDITVLKSQAGQLEQDMADTKGDVSQLKVSASSASVALSDAAGNISSLQASAKSYSAALSDTNSNVASVTATASELETKYADAAGDINKLQTDAKGTTQTLADAQGDIAKLKTRADGFDTQFSSTNGDISKLQTDASGTKQTLTNAQSDIAVLQSRADGFDTKFADTAGDINTIKVDASGMKQTLTDAQGNISTLQATATGFKNTLTDAQGNISTLQSDVAGLKKTTSDHAGNIATLQADAKTLTSQMSSAQGDISTLKQTASGFSSKVSGMETSLANANSKLDGITSNGGGRNLLWGTGTANGDLSQNGDSITKGAFNGYDAVKTNTAWSGRHINLQSALGRTNAKTGDWFTISVYVKADKQINDGGLNVYGAIGNAITDEGALNGIWMTSKPITTQWQQYAWSFQINDISLQRQDTTVAYNQDTGDNWIYWAGWMLEKGMIAHDWQPAPEDTQTYTQTQIKQTADSWNANLTSVKDGLTQSYTNLHTTVDGIQAQVYNSDGSSKITQLSNLIATKVSSTDFTALNDRTMQNRGTVNAPDFNSLTQAGYYTITTPDQGKNYPTGSWGTLEVSGQVTDVNGRLNQKYVSDNNGTVYTRQYNNNTKGWTAWSKGATESEIIQLSDDINIRVKKGDVVSQINQEAGGNTLIQVANGKGKLALNASSVIFSGSAFIPDAYITTLNADKLRFYDSSGNVATMSANLVQHDDDKVARTINLQYNGGYEVHASNTLGSILTMHDDTIRLAVKSSGSSGDQYSGVYAMTHYTQLSNYRSDGSAPGVFIYDDQFNILGDANGAGTSKGDMHISSPQLYLNGSSKLQAGGDHALLTIASDYTTIHADKNVWMETGNTQLHLDNSNNLEIFNKNNTNTSNYDVHLTVRGWATFTGWVNCLGLTQTSRLSTKTNIERLDTARALELINSADVATYQYKQDVANGGTKRHASVIIDDVNDVVRYQTPDEFISEDRSGRNDGDIVGYLMGAVQELTKKIKTLESKVG